MQKSNNEIKHNTHTQTHIGPENGKCDGMKFEITSHDLLKVLSLLLLFFLYFSVSVYKKKKKKHNYNRNGIIPRWTRECSIAKTKTTKHDLFPRQMTVHCNLI